MVSKRKQNRGFTMAEMLVALMVASIILAAAATMAGALSAGKTANDQVSRNGAYLLQLQTRLSDLIMRANGVVGKNDQGITLWLDKDGDGVGKEITPDFNEYLAECIEIQSSSDKIRITIKDQEIYNKMSKYENYGHVDNPIGPCEGTPCSKADHFNIQLSNVQFYLDNADKALVKHITIKYDMIENGVTQTYCVSGTLRGKTN